MANKAVKLEKVLAYTQFLLLMSYVVFNFINKLSVNIQTLETDAGKIITFFAILVMMLYQLSYSLSKEKIIHLLWLTNIFTVDNLFDLVSNTFQLVIWPLAFISFYTMAENDYKNKKESFILTTFVGVFCIFFYYLYFDIITIRQDILTRFLQNNLSYNILLILPWLLLLKRQYVKTVLIGLLLFITVFSLKRTAILALVLSFFTMFFVNGVIQRKKRFKIILISLVLFFISFLVFDYVNQIYDNRLLSRFENIQEDQGSGRIDIYIKVLKGLDNDSFPELIVGHGYKSVGKITDGLASHNDWLETIYSFGLIGLLILLAIFYLLIKKIFFLIRIKSIYSSPFTVSVVLFFLMSLVSHLVIYPHVFVILTSFWGYIFGKTNKKNIITYD
jgi:O-antigen ligase